MSLSIRKRMLLITLIPLIVSAILLTSHNMKTRIDELYRVIEDRGNSIVKQLAISAEYGVATRNKQYLSQIIDSVLQEDDIISVSINDHNHEVIASGVSSPDMLPKANDNDLGLMKFNSIIHQIELVDDEIFSAADVSEINRTSRHAIGYVSLYITNKMILERQYDIIYEGIFIMLVVLLLSAAVSVLMSNSVTGPIQKISGTISKIKSGDLSQRITVTNCKELSMLADGINNMAQSLYENIQSEKRLAEDKLHIEKIRARTTLDAIGEAVIATDADGMIVYSNTSAEKYTGWSYEESVDKHIGEILKLVDDKDGSVHAYPIEAYLQNRTNIKKQTYRKLIDRQQNILPIRDTATAIIDNQKVTGAVIVFHDISDLHSLHTRMAYLAKHDPLTGLFNRSEFESSLSNAIESAHNVGRQHVLCYLDLDNFKIINDRCGHIAGDACLVEIANTIGHIVRSSDIFARLGGDEFGLLLLDCDSYGAMSTASQIQYALKSFEFEWEGQTFKPGVSIGLVEINEECGSIIDVLSAADTACYSAKSKGPNNIEVYKEDEQSKSIFRLYSDKIKHAVRDNKLLLYGKPLHPIHTGNSAKQNMHELLVQIQDGDNIIQPMVFMPYAERYRITPEIDRWAISHAFKAVRNHDTDADSNTLLFISLSPLSIADSSLPEYIQAEADAYQINPSSICFYVPEQALQSGLTDTKVFLHRMYEIGYAIAISEFNGNFGCLLDLQGIDISFVKFSERLSARIDSNTPNSGLVTSIAQMCNQLGISTILTAGSNVNLPYDIAELHINYMGHGSVESATPFKPEPPRDI